MTRRARSFGGAAVLATAVVAAMHLGCEQILGIHDLDGGAGDAAGDDSGIAMDASGSSSGTVGSSASSGIGSGSGGASSASSASGSSGGRGSSTSGGSSTSSGADSGMASSGSSSSGGGPVTLTGGACTFSSDMHWTAGVYVIQCDLNVDATLTIDPGVIVKFGTGHGMVVSSTGTVNASGTAASPIVFTSVRDGTQGGNTGGTSTPARGDWTGVALGASGSTFDHCAFYYAGASDKAALSTDTHGVTVTNSIFGHNAGPTDSFSAAPALDAGSAVAGTTIQNDVFYDNKIPLRVSQNLSLDDTNSFDNGAPNSPQSNDFNGIEFVGGNCGSFNAIASNVHWSATKVPFIIGNPSSGNTCLEVDSGGQLTLAAKVTMKFFTGGRLRVGSVGMLTTAAGDVFTSIKDDASGGDTNGDQSTTSPAPRDWNGVEVFASGMTLDHCAFYYAGGSDAPALALNGVLATVTNSTFAHHQGPTDSILAAPALDAGSAAAGTTISNNVFYANRWPLRISQGVSIDDSNSFDNGVAAPGNPQPNEFNGIDFVGGNCGSFDAIVGNVSWKTKKVPFVIGNPSDTCLEVGTGGQLTVGDGVTMKFFQGGKLLVSSSTGTLATGTGDVFTSIKDDAHGGDTDHDMMSNAPSAGDWSGVVENGTCETWSNIDYSTAGCP